VDAFDGCEMMIHDDESIPPVVAVSVVAEKPS
jgi:hypothetical protein